MKPVTDHKIAALKYTHTKVGDDLWLAEEGVLFEGGEVRATYDWLLREPLIKAAH